jgi:hypothetical protein
LLENVVLERTFALFANLEKTWLENFTTLFGLFRILLVILLLIALAIFILGVHKL